MRDAQGGRLSGATITLVGPRGAVDVITNDQGLYRLAAIDPDTYDLSAAYDGFHPRREVGVVISVGQQLTIDFTLTPALAENVEVIGEAGIPYADEADLVMQLQRVLRDGSLVHAYRLRAQERVKKYYDWEHVVDRYEELFARMAGLPLPLVDDLAFDETASRSGHEMTPSGKR